MKFMRKKSLLMLRSTMGISEVSGALFARYLSVVSRQAAANAGNSLLLLAGSWSFSTETFAFI
jgi:hypothetical protein